MRRSSISTRVSVVALLALEKFGVTEAEGRTAGVVAAFAEFARAQEEEESHEAKVGNGLVEGGAVTGGTVEPQEKDRFKCIEGVL